MVSSTEIQNAILNTNIVEGFRAMPKYPIIAPVSNNGSKLGIIEITTILKELNIHAINIEISTITNNKLKIKFLIRNLVPFKKSILAPVTVTSYLSLLKIALTLGNKFSKILSIFEVEISATLKLILASCFNESISKSPRPKPSELFFNMKYYYYHNYDNKCANSSYY